jgi:3-oxoacyl-(acyl-carrier-protein) synthase
MPDPRVVVTGLGIVSPIGRGTEATWSAAMSGATGIRRRESDGLPVAEVASALFGAPFRDARGRPLVGRAASLAIMAGRDALDASGADAGTVDLVVGTTMGESTWIDTWPTEDAALKLPLAHRAAELLDGSPGSMAAAIADALGTRGRVSAVGGACAAGNFALARALDDIRSGRSDQVLAGGVDAFSGTALIGFAKLGALAGDGCRPFGLERQGLVLGEGAAFLLLESLERARSRDAAVLAVLGGAGLSCDAYHPTSPHPEAAGAVQALTAALEDADVAPDQVGWVSAHGTGTAANDRIEVMALTRVFGRARPPASSLKSLTGHGLGAASAIEAVLSVLALQHRRIPPTWHVGAQDPDCDWDVVVDGPRAADLEVVVNEAYAFGGCNAVTVFQRAG